MINEVITKRFLVISLGGKDAEYTSFRDYFTQNGFDVSFVYDERDLHKIPESRNGFDVVLVDVDRDPDKQIVAVQIMKKYYPHTAVVPITKESKIDIALQMRMSCLGLFDYITRPIHWGNLDDVLRRVFRKIDTDRMLKRMEQERETILNINRLVLSHMSYKDFCNALCLELRKIINFDYFSLVSRIEPSGEYYMYLFDLEQNVHNFQRGTELKTTLESFLFNEVSKSSKIIIRNEVCKNGSEDEKDIVNDGITSYMVYPLFINNALIGCINILSKHRAHFSETHSNLIGQVSAQITVTLMNAMLLDSLTASEEKYRDLVENAPEIIFKMDSHGRFLHVNKMGLEILGYSAKEMTSMYLFDLVADEHGTIIKKQYDTSVNSRKDNNLVMTLLTKDGKRLDAEIICSIQYDTILNDYLVRAFVRDVTERRILEKRIFEYQRRLKGLLKEKTLKLSETEKEMYNQRKFLDALIQNTNVYVVTITLKGEIVFVNRAIEKRFGYTLDEVIGKSIVDVFIPQDKAEELSDDIQMLFSGNKGEQIEIPFASRNQKVRDILWIVTYLKDEWNTISNINLFGYDITEQKILKEQLIQAEKMSSVGTMISGVAHELNNPLSIILNFSELILMCDNLSKSATNRLRHIIDASQRCTRIVENLLTFATKRKSVRKGQYICINEVLKNALELKINDFRVNNIEVEQLFSQSLPRTMADRVQLMQVFINLINNAYDAMKSAHGRGSLAIRTLQRGDKIVIEFEDDGPGILEPEKLFTPFYTTKEVGKGTGLGLAVSYGIIKEHGGTIVGRNWQRGAIFTVTLPIKVQTSKEIKLPVKGDYNLYGLRLLLVEDEVGIAESCSELLMAKGCHVTSVSSAKDAMQAIQEDRFDIVVMDLKMPGEISGIQFYEWMMGYMPTLREKVILMTGDTLSPEFRAFIEKSKVPVIPKPFRFNTFLEKIGFTAKKAGLFQV
ncbi:MAG: PAS domain S-box protein [Candidatus Brocadia sp. AMX2]|uniref:histidine kinase n=1 Tax=Candidatus Brocadia sinica JPN1 TaxID=1197129 RepID=A0ABQ0JZ62_9BACT|nr:MULTISPECIES: PAS domain S-box protein [Brocadia]MBC6931242.1 PAS domain S-box protein [Candidatus Brocadia sp.]MCK6467239.1 PAS domain S-box protein [Candidatus Brocadia sinica]KAA0246057.1 MAG: PAS domain S-box protein [Candidatus Brocadia sp. AMX2]MCE7865916.1 PAS domain S-box protein [Candidatus Brocadia sp. AMX2]MCQ3916354.1 PAS domain S-box protein [Candidatus Brocadia sp.]